MSSSSKNAYQTAPADYLTRITEIFGSYKKRALSFMEVRPGDHLLDAGCGTGDDLLGIAKVMRGEIHLYGVDLDPDTLDIARRRSDAAGAGIRFQRADLTSLPFGDGEMDVVRSDRVFQHLPEPERALKEMMRVTRPGGRVVGIDVDWGTLVLDCPGADLADRLSAFARDRHVNGRSGRKLWHWFREAGLTEVEAYADAVCVTDWEIACFIWGIRSLLDEMVETGQVSSAEAEAWWTEAESYANAGNFCGSMTGFVVRGTVAEA